MCTLQTAHAQIANNLFFKDAKCLWDVIGRLPSVASVVIYRVDVLRRVLKFAFADKKT